MLYVVGILVCTNIVAVGLLVKANRTNASRKASWQQDFNSISDHLRARPELRIRMVAALTDFLTDYKVGHSKLYRANLAAKIINLLFP